MAITSKTHERHFLFHGKLSDAPGRNESWDEYLRYRGDNRWDLIVEGTDFSGTSVAKPEKEAMSTTALVNWVLERDAEIAEGSTEAVDDHGEFDGDDPKRQFGLRAERLRDIAASVDATYCVACLDGWVGGSWPPVRQRAIRILDIKGVTRRGVWIRIYHSVYEVDTNLGPGYLYPPAADRTAKLVLKSESSMSPGRVVKVPTALMAKIAILMPDFESLGKK